MKKMTLLGNITPAEFLRNYWQKKPLLIRQALPGFQAFLARDDLFALAAQDDVESRLVTRTAGQWKLQSGPQTDLPAPAQPDWTLLVQGANLHNDAADSLLRQFRFIPDVRLDDLMISYASDGGGVGPHFDSYDVFLLQAHGQRRWRISAQKDLTLVEGLPLKILAKFKADEEFLLEAGDMLYLPPQYAHDGVAVGECITCSIGFRAPAYQELGEAFLQFMADSIDLPGRYADPDLAPARNPAEIGKPMLDKVAAELAKVRFTEDDIAIFLGEYMSEPKPTVYFEAPEPTLPAGRFRQRAAKQGVRLSRRTTMLYSGKHLFINGESFAIGREDRKALAALANQRMLSGAETAAGSGDVQEALYTWYQDGWLSLN